MRLNDAIFGLVLLALAAAVLVQVAGFPRMPGQNVGPALFPGAVAVGLAGCGAALLAGGIRRRHRAPWFTLGPWMRSPGHRLSFALVPGALLFYVLLAEVLGFLLTGTIILSVLFLAYRVRPMAVLPVALAVTVVVQQIFQGMLRVPLPSGPLPPLLW